MRAGAAALALTVLAGCADTSELAKACKLDPEPAATGLPPKRDPPVAWLGPQHKALRFHSFKRLGAQVAVFLRGPCSDRSVQHLGVGVPASGDDLFATSDNPPATGTLARYGCARSPRYPLRLPPAWRDPVSSVRSL
jgi:hypothetical protein